MKKIYQISFIICLLSFYSCTSGCLDWLEQIDQFETTIYEAIPTSVQYDIKYGYIINGSGVGSAHVDYREDILSVINGSITGPFILNVSSSTPIIVANNSLIEWNIVFNDSYHQRLGISGSVYAKHFMIDDITGDTALDLMDIQTEHPNLIEKYCRPQGNETIWFIEPQHPEIQHLANDLFEQSKSNNSFLIAKHIFSWLKQTTTYQNHPAHHHSQPATQTLQLKTGDCDDLSFLYLSLCRAVNIPARFIKGMLIQESNKSAVAIHHLWVEIFVGGNIGRNGWIPVECAGTGNVNHEINQHYGVEDASHLRLFIDDGSNQSLIQSTNHIKVTYEESMQVQLNQFAIIHNYTKLSDHRLCVTSSARTLC